MEILICKDEEQVARVAAQKVAERIAGNPAPVLGFATGSSPLGLYTNLQRMVEAGELDLSRAKGFALDEYVGIPLEHPESYHSVIRRTVAEPLRMSAEGTRVPDGLADDLDEGGRAYDQAIRDAGGIDCQILGIGSNGHIGFNEPFSPFCSRTRVVPLTAQTRDDNARFFDSIDQVPTHAVTQGLGTILDSRSAVMVAQGEGKADAIAQAIEGPLTVVCPASVLQFHPDVTIVIDEAAASKLQYRDHFQTV